MISKDITILNANSLVSSHRRLMFCDFLRDCPSDIFLISETHLKPQINFTVRGFRSFRCDRLHSNGGGSLILIKFGLKYRNFKIVRNERMELASLDIFLNNIWIAIAAVYIAPGSVAHDDINFASLLNISDSFIVGGDFNCRMPNSNNQYCNPQGELLYDLIHSTPNHNFILPSQPTCYRSAAGSVIDFFIVSDDIFATHNSVYQGFSFSDHTFVKLKIQFNVGCITDELIYQYNYTNIAGMNNFILDKLSAVDLKIESNMTPDEIDNSTIQLDGIFSDAVSKFTPQVKLKNLNFILSPQTLALKKAFRRLSRHLRNNIGNFNYATIKNELKHIKNMYRWSLRSDQNNFWANNIVKTGVNAEVHDLIRRSKPGKPSVDQIDSIIDIDNTTTIFGDRILEAFADRFESQHSLNTQLNSVFQNEVNAEINSLNSHNEIISFNELISPEIINSIRLNEVNNLLPPSQQGLLTDTGEIADIIKRKRNKKSSGYDGMPIFLIKHFSDNILLKITVLFNQMIAIGHFPTPWKHANITPIPKIGSDKGFICNWRPISQLNSLSKIFEKVIDNRLCEKTEQIIPESQFGFVNKRSTVHPLVRFTSDIASALNKREIVTAISIDIQSAFDTVWHDGLLFKLVTFGINPLLIKSVQNFLRDRTFCVGKRPLSSTRKIVAGVPQGSVLGPKLFNIFLSDLPNHDVIKILQYADDLLIYLTHRDPSGSSIVLNNFLNSLSVYYQNWKLQINSAKTRLINFTGTGYLKGNLRNKIKNLQQIKINDFIVQPNNSFKYLGVIFSANFKFNQHISYIIRKCIISKFMISKILFSKFLQPRFKLYIYKLYLRPIFQYASAIWLNPTYLTSAQIEKIRLLERKVIRRAGNCFRPRHSFKYISNANLYNTTSIIRIDRFLANVNIKYFQKCLNSESEFIRGLVEPFNISDKYYYPSYIYHLDLRDELFVNNNLLTFHIGARNPHSLVYNMAQ